ncbi:MAG: LptF/LptG family permease [Opitutales bacterium]|nr:LptF/LptG family permease [Opitutales bacterium]
MNRLQRYIFLAVFGACLGGVGLFVFILITGNAMRDILGLLADGRITFSIFFDLLMLLMPYAVSFAMPLGMLIGVLVVFGRLSANHELTAMRAAGLSIWSISAPVVFIALLGSFAAVWINGYHAPESRAAYRAILDDIVRTDPLRFIIPNTFIHEFPGYIIYVEERREETLRHLWVWELDEQRRAVRLLRAEEGRFSYDEAQDSLIMTIRNGFTELRDEDDPDNVQRILPTLSFNDARIRLPLDNLLGGGPRPRRISTLTFPQLVELRQDYRSDRLHRAVGEEDADLLYREQIRVQYHMSRNLAMAFSIFSLSLLGVPLGIQARRTETYANMGLALMIALSYYLAMIIIGWTEDSPEIRPDILVWMPNFVCQSAGIALLVRANQSR